jgi:hypothetical protein
MGRNELSTLEETKIIALVARGDSYAEIKGIMQDQHGRNLTYGTLQSVKKRNKGNLDKIRDITLAKQNEDAQANNVQANRIIKKQLNNTEMAVDVLTKAGEQYLNDEIDEKEYTSLVKSIKVASLTELVSISKEMHTQAIKPTDNSSSPEDLAAIRKALEEGDEVTLNQIIFKKNQSVV